MTTIEDEHKKKHWTEAFNIDAMHQQSVLVCMFVAGLRVSLTVSCD